MLGAFINQVEALINSMSLSPEEGQALIDAAQEVIDQLQDTCTSLNPELPAYPYRAFLTLR